MSDDVLSPLIQALLDLIKWLQDRNVRGIIIGGVAASLLGRPRVTRDIDALVLLDSKWWDEFLKGGQQFGFVPRIGDPLVFAQKSRVLLVAHEPSGIDIDISFGILPFEEEAVDRAVNTEVAGITIPLPTPEDLVIMKAVAHRPIDMLDIQSLMDAQVDIDLRRVRQWVREFSSVLEMPEIYTDLEKILAQRKII